MRCDLILLKTNLSGKYEHVLFSTVTRQSSDADFRDAYGFAMRPQHAQRYREYANLYREEEEKRSDRWNDFFGTPSRLSSIAYQ